LGDFSHFIPEIPDIQQVIAELNRAGVRMMDVPETNRKRALLLEVALTVEANKGNREGFLELLKQWRDCFN
jgi:hypothetical protein